MSFTAGIIVNQRSVIKRLLPLLHRRLVSTSNKKYETATADSINLKSKTETQKSWVTYGYDLKSKDVDRNAHHSLMFVSVTLCLVVGGLYWMYIPDHALRDWAQREAYLELARREKNGLLPIDPNFIDPSKIELPSDEELENVEIII